MTHVTLIFYSLVGFCFSRYYIGGGLSVYVIQSHVTMPLQCYLLQFMSDLLLSLWEEGWEPMTPIDMAAKEKYVLFLLTFPIINEEVAKKTILAGSGLRYIN
jgi:hypothetical protein